LILLAWGLFQLIGAIVSPCFLANFSMYAGFSPDAWWELRPPPVAADSGSDEDDYDDGILKTK